MLKLSLPTNSNTIVFAPLRNSPGKSDATGAFIPGAHSFIDFYRLDRKRVLYLVDNSKSDMPAQVFQAVENRFLAGEEIVNFVFFCHGFSTGIQFKIRSPHHKTYAKSKTVRSNWETFCRLVSKKTDAPAVILFACSTGNDPDADNLAPGEGDDSFGDALRDSLCNLGATSCRVFTHFTAGHAWRNPSVRIFDGQGSPYGNVGGTLVAQPGSAEFKKFKKLLDSDDAFAWTMVFQEVSVIQQQLV